MKMWALKVLFKVMIPVVRLFTELIVRLSGAPRPGTPEFRSVMDDAQRQGKITQEQRDAAMKSLASRP